MIKWIVKVGRYENGFDGVIGDNIKTFSIDWDGVNGSKNNAPHILTSFLPGFKPSFGGFETKEIACERAEDILKKWLIKTGLKV